MLILVFFLSSSFIFKGILFKLAMGSNITLFIPNISQNSIFSLISPISSKLAFNLDSKYFKREEPRNVLTILSITLK